MTLWQGFRDLLAAMAILFGDWLSRDVQSEEERAALDAWKRATNRRTILSMRSELERLRP